MHIRPALTYILRKAHTENYNQVIAKYFQLFLGRAVVGFGKYLGSNIGID